MHPFDTIIVISIACCIGFIPAVFVKKDLLLAVGYFVASTVDAFGGSYLALWIYPQPSKLAIIFGGILGAAVLVAGWHAARKKKDQDHC